MENPQGVQLKNIYKNRLKALKMELTKNIGYLYNHLLDQISNKRIEKK